MFPLDSSASEVLLSRKEFSQSKRRHKRSSDSATSEEEEDEDEGGDSGTSDDDTDEDDGASSSSSDGDFHEKRPAISGTRWFEIIFGLLVFILLGVLAWTLVENPGGIFGSKTSSTTLAAVSQAQPTSTTPPTIASSSIGSPGTNQDPFPTTAGESSSTSSASASPASPPSLSEPSQSSSVTPSQTQNDATATVADTGKTVTATLTGYGWASNDPPGPTCYDNSAGVNFCSTEGQGTYDDPGTFASDDSEFTDGTLVYIDVLERYLMKWDSCEQCSTDWASGAYHLDIWMGQQSESGGEDALLNCIGSLIPSPGTVVIGPPSGLPFLVHVLNSGLGS